MEARLRLASALREGKEVALSAVTVISVRCCSRQSKLCLPVQVPSSPLRRRNATPCAIIAARTGVVTTN